MIKKITINLRKKYDSVSCGSIPDYHIQIEEEKSDKTISSFDDAIQALKHSIAIIEEAKLNNKDAQG